MWWGRLKGKKERCIGKPYQARVVTGYRLGLFDGKNKHPILLIE